MRSGRRVLHLGTYNGRNGSCHLDGVSTICVFQFGQFEEVHDRWEHYVIKLTKNPAFSLRPPGGSLPHFAALVQNKLLPQILTLQVHSVI